MMRHRFRFSFFSILLLFLIVPFYANAGECISADDTGRSYTEIVYANPDLSMGGDYAKGSQTQKAIWVDTGLLTNGKEFSFEIQGLWTSWYSGITAIGIDTLVVPMSSLCVMGYKNGYNVDSNGVPQLVYKDVTDANNSDYKIIRNYPTEKIGIDGEFDFVRSIYKDINVSADTDGKIIVTPEFLEDRLQQNCWFTSGQGLYIGFFGKSGSTLPNLVTHLKSSNILCDVDYRVDRNGDGIISVDECIKVVNKDSKEKRREIIMAYYTPETTRCEYKDTKYKIIEKNDNGDPILDSRGFEIVLRKDDKAYVDGCYSVDDGGNKSDRTIFKYKAKSFYANDKGGKIGKNQRVKFIIYDKFYSDNKGFYQINMLSGVSDPGELKIVEDILSDIESMFSGERNEYGELEGGALRQYYNYIVKDSLFSNVARMLVILYMAFAGFRFALGMTQYTTKEMMVMLLKLTFVLVFTSPTSWDIYDKYIVRFFLDGLSSAIVIISNAIDIGFSKETTETFSNMGSLSTKFAFIDEYIKTIFSRQVGMRMIGFVFGVWYGFIMVPILYFLLIYFVWNLIKALYPYIMTFIQVVLALAVGPVFISLYLFETTKSYFNNWLAFLGGRFINMVFLFAFIYAFAEMIMNKIETFILGYRTCKMPLWQAITSSEGVFIKTFGSAISFGIEVWKTEGIEMNFIEACIEILMIVVLIFLFKQLLEKLPTIVDSMVDKIGEGEAGGLDPKTKQSALGLSTKDHDIISDLNSKFKYSTYERGKDGKMHKKEIGVFSTDFVKRSPLGGLAKSGGGIIAKPFKFIGNEIADKAKDTELGRKISRAVGAVKEGAEDFRLGYTMPKGALLGADFVNAYTNNYEKALRESKRYSEADIQQKTEEFRKKQEDTYIKKPLRKAADEIKAGLDKDVDSGKVRPEDRGRVFNERMDAKIREMFEYGKLESGRTVMGKEVWRGVIGSRTELDPDKASNIYIYDGKKNKDGFDLDYYRKYVGDYAEEQKRLQRSKIQIDRDNALAEKAKKLGFDGGDGIKGFVKGSEEAIRAERDKLERAEKEGKTTEVDAAKKRIDLLSKERREAMDDYRKTLVNEYEGNIKELIQTKESMEKSTDPEEFKRLAEENQRALDSLKRLSQDARDFDAAIKESKDGTLSNLAVPGLSENFTPQGVSDIGLGTNDISQLLGFNGGADALIMGDLGADKGDAFNEDLAREQRKSLSQIKQKFAKQEEKIAEYELSKFQIEIQKASEADKPGLERKIDEAKAKRDAAKSDIKKYETEIEGLSREI